MTQPANIQPAPKAVPVQVAEHVLKFMPPALIVASDAGARQGLAFLAKQYAEGGFLPEGLTMQGAIILMVAGIDYDLSPIEAVSKLYLIGGRVTPSAHELVAQALRRGVKIAVLEATHEKAAIRLSREGHPDFDYEYAKADAQKANLWGKKGPWSNDPRSMLMARAKSQALRIYAPDTLSSLYTDEEVSGGTGYIDPAGNFTPDPGITGDRPREVIKPFEGRAEEAPARVDAAAPEPVKPEPVKPQPVKPQPVKPEPPKTTVELTENVSAGIKPGSARKELASGKSGGDFERDGTIKEIGRKMVAQFGKEEAGKKVKALLKEKFGVSASTELGDLQVIDMMLAVNDLIKADKVRQAQEAANGTPAADEAPAEAPVFDPARGAGTRGQGPVAAGGAVDYDEKVANLFAAYVKEGREDEYYAVVEEFGYSDRKSSEQTKRLTVEALTEKFAATENAAD